jgi:pseudaminic acid synthase
MPSPVTINGRAITAANRPYIIAEVSANHNGSLDRAFATIKAAKNAGVDAVKIQTYTPDTMTIDVDNEDFFIKDGLWKDRSLYELYGEAFTPFEWHAELFAFAKKENITLFSSPFDETAVDLLESLGAPAYKIASFELVDLPLIAYIARLNKPMLMSTGMASIAEIGDAIETAKANGCSQIAIFHCISSYPAPLDEANLSAIKLLQQEFNVEVGLSDHTLGSLASVVATSLGATVIEKHFTLARADGGVDSTFSIEPDEMSALVKDVTSAHASLGSKGGLRSKTENSNKNFRRSLYFIQDIAAGSTITSNDVKRIRPGFGLAPKFLHDVIGKKATRNIKRGDRVTTCSFSES